MNSVKNYSSDNVKNHYVYSDLDLWQVMTDLGSRSWHFLGSSVTILWNIVTIHAFSEHLWPGQCLNHYDHSSLDLWLISLDKVHDTSLGPGQQSCEILLIFIQRVRNYGPDKLFAYVLTIMCIVTLTLDQWPYIKIVTRPWVQCNNSVKYYSIHAFSENLWPRQCLNHYEHSDLDLWLITLDQRHDTSLSPGQQSCEILLKFI
jgi:hypothetical protein